MFVLIFNFLFFLNKYIPFKSLLFACISIIFNYFNEYGQWILIILFSILWFFVRSTTQKLFNQNNWFNY